MVSWLGALGLVEVVALVGRLRGKWRSGYVFGMCVWVPFEQGSGAMELRVDDVVVRGWKASTGRQWDEGDGFRW